jgi:hypothetical protein
MRGPALALVFLLLPSVALAALPPVYYTNQSQSCYSPAQPCGTGNEKVTFYVPINTPGCATSVQGCMTTSQTGLDGKNDPITVDAVRLHKAQYATCASDSSNYRKYFNIGTVTYRSWLDQQMHTVQNVICYVHDTGGAFKGRPDKLDLATTLCPGCTDADAMRLASGSMVNSIGQGLMNSFAGFGGGQVVTQDYYCITSIEPVIVQPVPAGSVFPSNCYNQPPAQRNPFTQPFARMASYPMQPLSAQPFSQVAQNSTQAIQQSFGTGSTSTAAVNPAALLIVQPSSISRGGSLLLAWSSVGMSTQNPCQVLQGGAVIALSNAGSKAIPTSSASLGALAFTLSCTTASGQSFMQSASATVQ